MHLLEARPEDIAEERHNESSLHGEIDSQSVEFETPRKKHSRQTLTPHFLSAPAC